jgi:hypothetical protein
MDMMVKALIKDMFGIPTDMLMIIDPSLVCIGLDGFTFMYVGIWKSFRGYKGPHFFATGLHGSDPTIFGLFATDALLHQSSSPSEAHGLQNLIGSELYRNA